MTLVWDSPLDSSSLLTLMALADHANEEGASSYPGNKRLSHKTSMSVRQVQNNLRHLEGHGLIRRAKYAGGGRGKAVEWEINVPLLQTMHSSSPFLRNHELCDRKGCNLRPQTMNPSSPQPSGTINNRAEISISEENPRRADETLGEYLFRLSGIASEKEV